MEYIENKLSWEEFFTNELQALQQKMPTYDVESLSKSKLRLSLENRILDWKKYESWATETYGCVSIKENLPEATLKSYSVSAQQAYSLYASYAFWNQDLLPMFIWENQLIVFGLQYSPNLLKVPNHIFVLTPPRILNYFAQLLLDQKSASTDFNELTEMFGDGNTPIDGITTDAQPQISIDFKNLSSETVTNYTPRPRQNYKSKQSEVEIWDLVGERFEEYVYESRKQFDAFIILRINYDLTKLFKMDPDLERQNINEKLFEYSLRQNPALKDVVETGESVTLNAKDLGLELLNYKNICIAGIKRSNNVVGFFLGFKTAQPTTKDMELLEELAKESAQQAS